MFTILDERGECVLDRELFWLVDLVAIFNVAFDFFCGFEGSCLGGSAIGFSEERSGEPEWAAALLAHAVIRMFAVLNVSAVSGKH